MVTRLTALLLSFCIGLPMCWCCLGEAPREELAGCCSTAHPEGCPAQQPEDSPTGDLPCCGHHQDARDTVKRLIFSPKPEPPPVLLLAGWQEGLPVMRPELSMTVETPRHERGPPTEPPRLFLRHRALLL